MIDHKQLLAIFDPKAGIPTLAVNRWALLLSNYTNNVSKPIEWVQSSKNIAVWLSWASLPGGQWNLKVILIRIYITFSMKIQVCRCCTKVC